MIKAILFILLFALPLSIDNHCYYTGIIKNSILYIGAIWIWYFFWLKKPKWPDISIILFVGWCGLSYFLHPYKTGNPGEEMIILISYLAVYLAAEEYLTINRSIKWLEWIVYILFGFFIYDYWGTFISFKAHFVNITINRYTGTFGQSGVYGCWLAMTIVFLLAQKRLIACLMGLLLLWLTGSRISIISLILAVSLLGYVKINRVWLKRVILGILLFILIILSHRFYKLNPQIERLSFWRSTIAMIEVKPVQGWGIGSFRIYYPLFRDPYITAQVFKTPNVDLHHAHNLFFELGAELGIIGVGLFMFMIWKHWTMTQDWGLICGIFACLIANLTDVSFYFAPISFLFWLILGLMAKRQK